jgi:plastocyanin
MRRVWLLPAVVAAAAAVAVGPSADAQPAGQWATVKGQVVFPANKPVPQPAKLEVTQDKAHCLEKGAILDEAVQVNPKNRGIKNVVVWLRPDNTDPKKSALDKNLIHPDDAKRKAAEVVIDQPQCMFVPRVVVARAGDTLIAKNSAPVAHNFFWTSGNNGQFNPTIPANQAFKLPDPLKPEATPIQYKCSIHPWMIGYVRVFDHPYFAVTDEDGRWEIKDAPVGKFRVVYWHENGFKDGAKGRFGEPVEIKGPTTEVKPVVFDVSPRK